VLWYNTGMTNTWSTKPQVRKMSPDPEANIMPHAADEWLKAGRRTGKSGEELMAFANERIARTRRDIHEMVQERSGEKDK